MSGEQMPHSTAKDRYHHGDLRAALLDAAEAELREHGVEGFTLRACARRAGVSHAAPAHHFGDAKGLLTALAAIGYQRFLATQARRKHDEAPDAQAQLVAAGLGYIDFAQANPALFRLIFASDRPDHDDPELCAAARAAFSQLVADVAAVFGANPEASAQGRAMVASTWALVHGMADLAITGRLPYLPAGDEGMLRAILVRCLFAPSPGQTRAAALAPPPPGT
jgi:AcrR family transcriptional regulator